MKSLNIQKEIDQAYTKYHKATNMSFTELLLWSRNPKSKEASLSRGPIRSNLSLLKKKKGAWKTQDIEKANKTISYLARAKKIKRAKGYKKTELTPNEIALKNWGFDIFKKK
jgi:hypothetical protein